MKFNRLLLGLLVVSTGVLGACDKKGNDKNLPTDITVSVTKLDMKVGDKAKIEASLVYPAKEAVRRGVEPPQPEGVQFSKLASDTFFTIDSEGNVEALAVGVGKIYVEYNYNDRDGLDLEKTVDIIVTEEEVPVVKPETITINNASPLEMIIEETITIDYTLLPSDAANKKVKITANPQGFVNISDRYITGLKVGTTTIRVESEEVSSVYDEITLTVKEKPIVTPLGIIIEEGLESFELVEGNNRLLSIRIEPPSANSNVIWNSNNTSVATVEQNGLVTAIKEGSAVLTCKAQSDTSVSDTITVNVKSKPVEVIPVTSLAITGSKSVIEVGDTFSVGVNAYPSGASNNVTWTSSDNSVASVNHGLVKGLTTGSTKIRAISVGYPTVYTEFDLEVTVATAEWPEFVRVNLEEIPYYNLPSASFIKEAPGKTGEGYRSVICGTNDDPNEKDAYYREFYVAINEGKFQDYLQILEDNGWETLYDDSYGYDYAIGEKRFSTGYYEIELSSYNMGDYYELRVVYELSETKDWPLTHLGEIIDNDDVSLAIPEFYSSMNEDDVGTDFFCFDEGNNRARIEIYNTAGINYNNYIKYDLTNYTREYFSGFHQYDESDVTVANHYIENKLIKRSGGYDALLTIGLGELSIGETYTSFPLERIKQEFAGDSSVNLSGLSSDDNEWWGDEYYVDVVRTLSNGKKEIHVYAKSSMTVENGYNWVTDGLISMGKYGLDVGQVWRPWKNNEKEEFRTDHYLEFAEDTLLKRGLYLIISSI